MIGIAGEIVPTPGHSDDSVSLVLDDGSAFTGDLTPLALAGEEGWNAVVASWQRLRALGANRIYPGHGPRGQCTARQRGQDDLPLLRLDLVWNRCSAVVVKSRRIETCCST